MIVDPVDGSEAEGSKETVPPGATWSGLAVKRASGQMADRGRKPPNDSGVSSQLAHAGPAGTRRARAVREISRRRRIASGDRSGSPDGATRRHPDRSTVHYEAA